jgi:glycosyltransferase involved in cell wall biosynthesis
MKVMHLIDSAGIYGAEVMLLNLMEEHQAMGLVPLLLSIEPADHSCEARLSDEATQRGLDVVKYRSGRGYSWASAVDIMRIAEKQEVSIIHSHGYKGNILIGSIPRFMRKMPVMSTVHGWTSVRKFTKIGLYVLLDRFFLRRMDAIVNVSPATKMRIGKGETFVVENGIPPLKFVDPDSKAEADSFLFEFCREGFILGTISRLSAEKGINYLIEAVKILSSKGVDVKAIVIGEGPQKQHLQKRILDLGLSNRIFLAGYRNNAFHYLPLFDLFVLPSLTEGLPITILEAMQAEVPIIATRVGGIPGLLENGSCGIMVAPGDSEALAKAVTLLSSDTALAQGMAKQAREEALSKYSSRRMAEKYLKIYETVRMRWES